jgi:hypothetical protein
MHARVVRAVHGKLRDAHMTRAGRALGQTWRGAQHEGRVRIMGWSRGCMNGRRVRARQAMDRQTGRQASGTRVSETGRGRTVGISPGAGENMCESQSVREVAYCRRLAMACAGVAYRRGPVNEI